MSRRKQEGSETSWQQKLGDVRPLEGRDKRRLPESPPPPAAPARRRETAAPAEFAIERDGERWYGRAEGVSREQLRRLRRGEPPPQQRIDLHGLEAAAAAAHVREALLAAQASGGRCVLVVHGRGLHSESGAVLKQALPGWLAEPPLGAQVLAFASAAPADGGAGASYVLLRRRR